MGLPLPRVVADVGPGGGIVTARRGINALRQSEYENDIARSNAQYAPYTNYANALSKIAYGKMAPATALATFMSSPAAANMTREQAIQMGGMMQNYLKSVGNLGDVLPQPNQMGGQGGNSMLDLLKNGLMSTLGIGGNQPVNSLNQQQQPPQAAPAEYGAVNQATPEYVSQIANNGNNAMPTGIGIGALPAHQRAAAAAIPGTQGGENPATSAKAVAAGLETGVTGEASVQNEMWKQRHAEDANEAINSQKVDDLVGEFSDAYDRTNKYQKGPIAGSAPPWFSEAADTADRASAGMADAVARAQQQGHITQSDRATYSSMKLGRSMRPETKANAEAFITGMNERVQERAVFNVAAQKKGLTTQEANAVWLNYIKHNPFYSKQKHELIQENFNRWPEYLTDKKIQESLNPSPGEKSASTQSSGGKMFHIYSPQGQLVATGSQEAAAKFLKDHRGYYQKAIR